MCSGFRLPNFWMIYAWCCGVHGQKTHRGLTDHEVMIHTYAHTARRICCGGLAGDCIARSRPTDRTKLHAYISFAMHYRIPYLQCFLRSRPNAKSIFFREWSCRHQPLYASNLTRRVSPQQRHPLQSIVIASKARAISITFMRSNQNHCISLEINHGTEHPYSSTVNHSANDHAS